MLVLHTTRNRAGVDSMQHSYWVPGATPDVRQVGRCFSLGTKRHTANDTHSCRARATSRGWGYSTLLGYGRVGAKTQTRSCCIKQGSLSATTLTMFGVLLRRETKTERRKKPVFKRDVWPALAGSG